MTVDPALAALLEMLPEPGRPFPAMERWLTAFKATLDLIYSEDSRGSLVCPECGGPKSLYATRCIKHNAGTVGNAGGGGDRRPAEVREALAEARSTGGPMVITPQEMPPQDRQELSLALARKAPVGQVVEIVRRGPGRPPGSGKRPPRTERCPQCKVRQKSMQEPVCSRCASDEAPGERVKIGVRPAMGQFGVVPR